MRYLVTGGCGFIGSRLVHSLLADRHEVAVVDDLSTGRKEVLPSSVALYNFPVESPPSEWGALPRLDGVFHLAAIASVERAEAQPSEVRTVNVEGTRSVIEAALQQPAPIPVVLASSAAVYGESAGQPLSEDHALDPIGIYGASKLAAERVLAEAFREAALPAAAVRLFNVYGPWPLQNKPPAGVVPAFLKNLVEDRPLTIHGSGRQTRDFIFIDDVVALLRSAMQAAGECDGVLVVNGCTGKATSLTELVTLLSDIAERPLHSVTAPTQRAGILHSLGDPRRARTALEFVPKVDLRRGLSQTLKDYLRASGCMS